MIARRSFLSLALAGPVCAIASRSKAAEPAVFQRDGYAIGGTDPVAYHEGDGPVAGDPAISMDWMGATWLFASDAARAAFAAAPETLAPAFGGYCAFAASRGYLAPTIPEAWHVHEGRLFLNASLRALELWRAELPGVIAAGEANWPAILG